MVELTILDWARTDTASYMQNGQQSTRVRDSTEVKEGRPHTYLALMRMAERVEVHVILWSRAHLEPNTIPETASH